LKGEVSFIEHDRTKVNHTLPFPLRHSFYVDFTHDNQMAAVVSAMGLFKDESPPMASSLDPARQWVFSSIAPFGGRLVVERISCAGALFVRVLANDRVLKLTGNRHHEGIVPLDDFVTRQGFATSNGNGTFATCLER